MDIEKLIERLQQYSQSLIAYKLDADFADACEDAVAAISTLQTEAKGMRSNWYKSVEKIKELRAELEQARESLDFARTKDAEIVRLGKELEQAKAEITRLKYYEDKCHDCPIVCAKTEIIKAHEELEAVQAELEQVKRDFDGICEYIDSEGFLRKQFCENGNPDLEPCIFPSLQQHQGYIDSDDCEGCDHFCNSWRGPKEV